MAFALFEENGDLKSGTVLADNGTSLQVELVTGRRAKIKAAHIYMRFDSPSAESLLPAANEAAGDIDIDFLWECAPEGEFGFQALASEYFGSQPDPVQMTALLAKLKSAPIYFQRKGRGQFRAAPQEQVQAALAAQEKRRQRDALIATYAQSMVEGSLPDAIATKATELLVRPDKMSLEFKALDKAMSESKQSAERLLFELGAFESPYALHQQRFAAEQFPYGVGFPTALEQWTPDEETAARLSALPVSATVAFSIDDSSTTEIDDAFSVQQLEDGRFRVGIHIAAPAMAVAPDSDLDRVARERMSTVYMPGDKITMLPAPVVQQFSLDAGKDVPALSLYFELNEAGTALRRTYSVAERIHVADNLRHDELDELFTQAALEDDAVELPHGQAMRVLWQLTLAQLKERERVRGKPEPKFRTDFSFSITDDGHVDIIQRRRDAPLSRIVAEMMILANSQWGLLLADRQIAGIYRSQQGGRVRMSTQALPHEGLGVQQYIWSTSPLRRYIDLINQRQLLAAVEQSTPVLTANSAEIFSLMPAFDARHSAYQDFQQRMERYWCMRWLTQQTSQRYEAAVVRDDLVRLADAPLYFRASGAPMVAPGRRLTVDVLTHDLLDLSVDARFVELIEGHGDGPSEALDESADEIAPNETAPPETVPSEAAPVVASDTGTSGQA
ncbi:MAG: ribonuclease catalytic domain-containing protein [Burkholderiaceae bacterium]